LLAGGVKLLQYLFSGEKRAGGKPLIATPNVREAGIADNRAARFSRSAFELVRSARSLDSGVAANTHNCMKSTVSISEGQNNFPALVKVAETGNVVTVTRHDEPVACVMGYKRMSAVAETLELMGNTAAMRAIREHQAGKTKFGELDDIPE
jgi:antitoxin YefM